MRDYILSIWWGGRGRSLHLSLLWEEMRELHGAGHRPGLPVAANEPW